MAKSPRGLAETFVTMLNEHDPNLVDRFVARDYINHNVFVGDGREANRRFWAAFFTRSIDIWRIDDGMFVEHWDELNTLQLLQQMGVLPTESAGPMSGEL